MGILNRLCRKPILMKPYEPDEIHNFFDGAVLEIAHAKLLGTSCAAPYVKMCVRGLIGGKSSSVFKVRLDTGADITMIPESYAKTIEPLLLGRSVLIRNCSGDVRNDRTYLVLCSLPEMGNTCFRPERGVCFTKSKTGLLGMDILYKHFDLEMRDGKTYLKRRASRV